MKNTNKTDINRLSQGYGINKEDVEVRIENTENPTGNPCPYNKHIKNCKDTKTDNKDSKKYFIKSYSLSVDGKQIGVEMFPISTIIKALQKYGENFQGMTSALDGDKTVREIVNEKIK